jgi:hypothetical protein
MVGDITAKKKKAITSAVEVVTLVNTERPCRLLLNKHKRTFAVMVERILSDWKYG